MNDEEPAAESRPLVEGRRAVHHSRKVALVRVDRIVGFLRPGRNQSTSRPGRTGGDVVIVGGQPTLRCFAIARSYSHSVEIALEHPIDDTTNRNGAIDGSRAFGNNLDSIPRLDRNPSDIDRLFVAALGLSPPIAPCPRAVLPAWNGTRLNPSP